MQPLDLIKTRLQLQRTGTAGVNYSGVIDCFKKMYIHEGFLSFYKGIVPPVLAETPKRAVKVMKFSIYFFFFFLNNRYSSVAWWYCDLLFYPICYLVWLDIICSNLVFHIVPDVWTVQSAVFVWCSKSNSAGNVLVFPSEID